LLESLDRDHPSRRDHRRLGAARGGDDDRADPGAGGALGHRQGAGHGADRAVQRQLARERHVGERCRPQLLCCGEDGGGDREVEPGTRLAQVCGGQVGGDPLLRELEARVRERRAHPLARLADRGVRQADERERRQALADVDLDPDLARLDPEQGEGAGDGEHPPTVGGSLSQMARKWSQIRSRGRAMRRAVRPTVAAMTVARQSLGRRAEELVAQRLQREGWVIVARNARPGEVRGEIDLIGVDRDALVFVEVKARRAGSTVGPEAPALAVGPRKQAKLRALAVAWLRARGYDVPRHRHLRFDVVGLRLDVTDHVVEYEHLRAAF
jgi:putative endonuclease